MKHCVLNESGKLLAVHAKPVPGSVPIPKNQVEKLLDKRSRWDGSKVVKLTAAQRTAAKDAVKAARVAAVVSAWNASAKTAADRERAIGSLMRAQGVNLSVLLFAMLDGNTAYANQVKQTIKTSLGE